MAGSHLPQHFEVCCSAFRFKWLTVNSQAKLATSPINVQETGFPELWFVNSKLAQVWVEFQSVNWFVPIPSIILYSGISHHKDQ